MKNKLLLLPISLIVASASFCVASTYALIMGSDESSISVSSANQDLKMSYGDISLYSPTTVSGGVITDGDNALEEGATEFSNGGTCTKSGNEITLYGMCPGDSASFKINFTNNSNVDIKYNVILKDTSVYEDGETIKLSENICIRVNQIVIDYGKCATLWNILTKGSTPASLDVTVELPAGAADSFRDNTAKFVFVVQTVQANTNVSNGTCNINMETTDYNNYSCTCTNFSVAAGTRLDFEVSSKADTYFNIDIKVGTTVYSTVNLTTLSDSTYTFYFQVNNVNVITFGSDTSPVGEIKSYTVINDTTFKYVVGCCIVKGTPITMGDYTYKNVEDLVPGDQILAYDFFEGKFVSTEINYTMSRHSIADTFKVNLDNNKSITIANNEDMFDATTRKYFTIGITNYQDVVGKKVLVNNNGVSGTSVITSVEHKREEVDFYTVYSKGLVNYVANDALMMFEGSNGFSYKYTVTKDYKIDMDVYEADVEKYGLLTYEDCPQITKEMFDEFDIATASFLLGKHLISEEEVNLMLIDMYREYTTMKPKFLNK